MFTKTLSDRRTATVTREHGEWSVAIDGQPYTTGTLRKLASPQGPATHVIGTTKVIGFTADEVARLQRILDAEHAAFLATPAGCHVTLTTDLEVAYSTWTSAREHAANTGDWSRVHPAQIAVDAAQAALDAFDDAHPEFAAAAAAQRKAREEESLRAAFRD